jgi:prevent-host-death family protein
MSCVALFEAKNRLTDFVHQVEDGEPIELTRHGTPVAVLVGIDRFREMKQSEQNFSSACTRYRTEWANTLAEEAAENGALYNDPFDGIRDASNGRTIDL